MATNPQISLPVCVTPKPCHMIGPNQMKLCGLVEPNKEGFKPQKFQFFLLSGIEKVAIFLDKAHYDHWPFCLVRTSLPWLIMCMHFHIPDDGKKKSIMITIIGQVSLIVERKSVFCLLVCVIVHSHFWSKQTLTLHGILSHWEGFGRIATDYIVVQAHQKPQSIKNSTALAI